MTHRFKKSHPLQKQLEKRIINVAFSFRMLIVFHHSKQKQRHGLPVVLSSDVHFKLVIVWREKTQNTHEGPAHRSRSHFFKRSGHVYLGSPPDGGWGRCCCRVSVRDEGRRRRGPVWEAWWLPGCRAGWEACASEETSDTAAGTSCRRWFWYLRAKETEASSCSRKKKLC